MSRSLKCDRLAAVAGAEATVAVPAGVEAEAVASRRHVLLVLNQRRVRSRVHNRHLHRHVRRAPSRVRNHLVPNRHLGQSPRVRSLNRRVRNRLRVRNHHVLNRNLRAHNRRLVRNRRVRSRNRDHVPSRVRNLVRNHVHSRSLNRRSQDRVRVPNRLVRIRDQARVSRDSRVVRHVRNLVHNRDRVHAQSRRALNRVRDRALSRVNQVDRRVRNPDNRVVHRHRANQVSRAVRLPDTQVNRVSQVVRHHRVHRAQVRSRVVRCQAIRVLRDRFVRASRITVRAVTATKAVERINARSSAATGSNVNANKFATGGAVSTAAIGNVGRTSASAIATTGARTAHGVLARISVG